MSYSEFVIWGVPGPNAPCQSIDGGEIILLDKPGGAPITSRDMAARYMAKLGELGCTRLRVQHIPFDDSAIDNLTAQWKGL